MKKNNIILSKTVKLPIPGIQYSNKQVSVTIDYQEKDFNMSEATDEINQYLEILKNNDPEWIKGGG